MADPFADTVRASVETLMSTGGAASAVALMLGSRARFLAIQIARIGAIESAATAPIWRWVRVAGQVGTNVVRGTSMAASVTGAASLALTLGVPMVVAAGVWVALGAGYNAAKEEVKKKGYMRGFSKDL